MKTICTRPRSITAELLPAAILIGLLSLLAGCATRKPEPPDMPFAHFLEPGSTNTVVVPSNCSYGVWMTDRGLLYLQGLLPSD